jgi:hypothetical protein
MIPRTPPSPPPPRFGRVPRARRVISLKSPSPPPKKFGPIRDILFPERANVKRGGPRLIQLGKYGDLVNVLPLVKFMSERSGRPVTVVCREPYSHTLEGTSYAVAQVTNAERSTQLELLNGDADTQLCGESQIPYNIQQWLMVDMADEFYSMFPVFDRRNKPGESILIESTLNFDMPVLLFTTEAESSDMGKELQTELRNRIYDSFGDDFQLVDIGKMRTDRIYDMLGLMELASALITVDSAMLHVATACNVPVVALVSDHHPREWRASATKRNVMFRCHYDEVLENWGRIKIAVKKGVPELFPSGRIVHVVPTFRVDRWDITRRNALASLSWGRLHSGDCEFAPYVSEDATRKHDCKGGRTLPFLKDALAFGIDACASDSDIICFTNTDVVLSPGFGDALRYHMRSNDFCCSFRMCYELGERPDFTNRSRTTDYGRDMFAFRRSWLVKNLQKIPDFLLGMGGWDFALAMWFRSLSGRYFSHNDHCKSLPECEIQLGFVWHETHRSEWTTSHTKEWERARASQLSLVERFLVDIGMKSAQCKI